MMLIRAFEQALARRGDHGFQLLSSGEEAVAVGLCSALTNRDQLLTGGRSIGPALARGLAPDRVMAELPGRSSGTNRGKGGRGHLANPKAGFFGAHAVVGGNISIAVGVALSMQMSGSDGIVAIMFGDGAAGVGALHELLNIAAIWNLPVLFVCNNNQFSVSTPRARTCSQEHFGSRRRLRDAVPDDRRDGRRAGRRCCRGGRGKNPGWFRSAIPGVHFLSLRQSFDDGPGNQNPRGTRFHQVAMPGRTSYEGAALRLASWTGAAKPASTTKSLKSSPELSLLRTLPNSRTRRKCSQMSGKPAVTTEKLFFREAISRAMREEMRRNERIFIIGQDVGAFGGSYREFEGLFAEFGAARVRDTPVAEAAMVGVGVGLPPPAIGRWSASPTWTS